MNEASAAAKFIRVGRPMTETKLPQKMDIRRHQRSGERSDPLPVLVSERPDDRDGPLHLYRTRAGADEAPLRREAAFYAVLVTKMYEGSGERSDPPSLCIFIDNS